MDTTPVFRDSAIQWTIAKHHFGLPRERRVPAVIETAGWEFRNAVKILAVGLGNRSNLVGESFTVADILFGIVTRESRTRKVPVFGPGRRLR